jgi:hypothetical protein
MAGNAGVIAMANDLEGDIVERPDGQFEVRLYNPSLRVVGTFPSFGEAWAHCEELIETHDAYIDAVQRGHVH